MAGKHLLTALAGASLLPLMVAAPAHAQNQSFLDIQAGVGYSSNPELRVNGSSSVFGRVSAFGFSGWSTERSTTNLSGYVENTSYFRRYGNRQIWSLDASHSTQVNETTRLFGNLGFSGDLGAQLSSRFFGPPADSLPVNPILPDTAVIVVTPDLVALNQRQYRFGGSGGASFVLSPRDSIIGTVGAQRIWFSGSNADLLNYTSFDTSLAWQRQVNERLSFGVRLIASRSDYVGDRSITSYGPQLTGNLALSENLDLGGAIGFVRQERKFDDTGEDSSTELAFDASLCRRLEYERFCGRVARSTQSAALGFATTSTTVTGEYSRRLSATDQLQASLAFVRTDAPSGIGFGQQNLYSLAGSYDKKISQRLSAGVTVAARKFTYEGVDPKADLGGTFFIRNRFGSVR